jgi:Mor family transcriptional regulator
MAPQRRTAEERFWASVKRGFDQECWLWKRHTKQRYPKLRLDPFGASELAHRFSYMLAHGGTIPDGLVVMHTCDNTRCVNPSHLVVGTQAENIRDKCLKRRQAMGSRNAMAKLTEARACAVVADYNAGATIVGLARRERVSRSTIERLLTGKVWGHIAAKKMRSYSRSGDGHAWAKLTKAVVAEARSAYAGKRGEVTALARRYGVSKSTISKVLRGKRWLAATPVSSVADSLSSPSQV